MSFSDWLTPRLGWPLLLITLARSATSLDQEILVRAMRMDSSEHKSVELSEEDIAVALDEYEVSCEFPLLLFAPTASSLASRPLAGTHPFVSVYPLPPPPAVFAQYKRTRCNRHLMAVALLLRGQPMTLWRRCFWKACQRWSTNAARGWGA